MLSSFIYIIAVILIIVAAPIVVMYLRILSEKEFVVRSVTGHPPANFGDLYFADGEIHIKNYRRRTYPLHEVQSIKGYTETTQGLEEYCCVDIILKNGKGLLFDATKQDQRQLLNFILVEQLHCDAIDWNDYFCPFSAEAKVLYSAPE